MIFNRILIIVFFVLIWVPFGAFVLDLSVVNREQENRKFAAMPKTPNSIYDLKPYLRGAEDYYTDHFGFRAELIVLDSVIDKDVLRKNQNERVVIGREGWLFYRPTIQDVKHTDGFTEIELSAWAEVLSARHAWAEERGKAFYFVVAQNKASIYSEYLPYDVSIKGDTGRVDQLKNYLEENTEVDMIDLSEVIVEEKSKGQLYHKGDTHWNDNGAYIGYKYLSDVIERDFPKYQTLSKEEFDFSEEVVETELEGLYNMLLLGAFFEDKSEVFDIKEPSAELVGEEKVETQSLSLLYEVEGSSAPSAVFFRDSFSDAFIPFFQESFSEVVFYWHPSGFYTDVIEENDPDIIVEVFVERRLREPIPAVFNTRDGE